MKKIKLYDYQQKMLEEIINVLTTNEITRYRKKKGYEEGNSVIVQMPTGTGKTYVMASVVKWFLITTRRVRCGLLRTAVNWWSRCNRHWTDSAWTMGRKKWC